MVAGRFFYSPRSDRYRVFKAAELPSLILSYVHAISTTLYSLPTRLAYVYLNYILVLWTTPGTPVGQDLVRRTHELQNTPRWYNEFAKTKFTKVPRDAGFVVLLLLQDVEDVFGVGAVCRLLRGWLW